MAEPKENQGAEQPEKMVPFKFTNVQVPKGNQRASELVVLEPAKAISSAFGLEDLTDVGDLNALGTPRPTHLLPSVDDQKSRLYLMPIPKTESVDTLEVIYSDYCFTVNLYPIFRLLNRLVPAGLREVYQLHKTTEPVTIGDFKGMALYIKLNKPKRQPVMKMSEEKRAKLRAKRAARKSAPPASPEEST